MEKLKISVHSQYGGQSEIPGLKEPLWMFTALIIDYSHNVFFDWFITSLFSPGLQLIIISITDPFADYSLNNTDHNVPEPSVMYLYVLFPLSETLKNKDIKLTNHMT